MLQVEIYVADLKMTAELFTSVFGLVVEEEKLGFKKLSSETGIQLMLFSPTEESDGESHWALPADGEGGKGVEIVIVTTDAALKLETLRKRRLKCSDLRQTPWGTKEFTFHLKEGYLLRIKEPALA